MLFNSTLFIFVFLPLAVGVFYALAGRLNGRAGLAWLIVASLFFYGLSEPAWLALLIVSIVGNFAVGLAIQRTRATTLGRAWLILGIAFDLCVLGWFKYTGFALENLVALGVLDAQSGDLVSVALPLAISFFTFQQIAYLVETYQGQVRETRFFHYFLFVAFFPKLIAGPIVHHEEIMEQLDEAPRRRFDPANLAIGLTLLSFGLFKKVVLADGIGARATPLFVAADLGIALTFTEAWVAALAYTFQVYFDFSGYSDMAIGAARCFGIVLPLNFHSPYKATNISEFWRRWHVTLSRWLRLYLFVPISRTLMRRGEAFEGPAIIIAQLVTMLLCGLWHGAGWGFVVWGGLHGLLLVGHDGWELLKHRLSLADALPRALSEWLGRTTLMASLAATFVIFRAADLDSAWEMLRAMFSPVSLAATFSEAGPARFGGHADGLGLLHLTGLFGIVWLLPNTQELLAAHRPVLDLRRFVPEGSGPRIAWRPNLAWAAVTLLALCWSLYTIIVDGYEDFVYRFF
jgi:alginate O-acetyltransferase complex protein AlgI